MQQPKASTSAPSLSIFYEIYIIIAGLVLPLLLIPVIQLTGYSEIIEEVAKALVVMLLILKLPYHRLQILAGIGFGFLFGLSENFLYLSQFIQNNDVSIFWQRFLWTVPMHMATALVLVLSGIAGRVFFVFGFIGALIMHVLYNALVSGML